MGNVSYSAHISNGKSAITSKSKLLGVAKHNLRKYKSPEYSSDNILLLRGTEDLYQDVKNVYHQEFDEVVQQYNQKQKRADRRIGDYFEHVANLNQDMAVEIIFQCGDKEFWEEHTDKKEKMYNVYAYLLSTMEKLLPNFKVANAVIHFDEASPHMHVVGVPVWEGAKKGLAKKVSKRNVFTPESLSVILQDKLREEAGSCFKFNVKEELAEKKQGRNLDLSVMEYKVAKETERLEEVQREVVDTDNELFASKLAYRQVQRENEDELREIKQEISEKQSENLKLDYAISYKRDKLEEYEDEISKWEQFKNTLKTLKEYISAYLPLSPLIEEFANCVEHKKDIEAGNSFRGLLNALNDKLEWVSRTDDSLGYDIRSYNVDEKREMYIEVKTTTGSSTTPFYISENEIDKSRELKDKYYIYRLYKMDRHNPKNVDYFILQGDISTNQHVTIEKRNCRVIINNSTEKL